MVLVSFGMQMVMYTRENGSMTKLTERVCTFTSTVLSMRENGRMICRMVLGWNSGQMGVNTRVTIGRA